MNVAAIIPTHNRARLLGRALRSVLEQSLAPREVAVVDDGSTDGTEDLLAREFPALRLLRQEHRGVSAARNLGIRSTTSEWIAFLDSDDEWHRDKLAAQADALAAAPGYRVLHCDEVWIRSGRRVNPGKRHAKRGGHIFQQCAVLCAISPSAAVIHRSLLDEVGLFDEALPACEDYDLWLRITAREPVLHVARPLVTKHGGHEDQLSRTVWGLDRFRIRALEKLLHEGDLAPADRQAAVAALLEKIEVYLGGLLKRGRQKEARLYLEKRYFWRVHARCTPRSGDRRQLRDRPKHLAASPRPGPPGAGDRPGLREVPG